MESGFGSLPFRPADILLPQGCDMTLWSVAACDQYTSQPEYWQRVEERVGRAPSTLRLILPESTLDGPQVETDIMAANSTMARYLREGLFRTLPQAMIYVERTLDDGRVRRGLVGMADLTQYDYEPGSGTPIRATEGVVLSRIPPRVAVRKNAPLELPHAMLLADDPEDTLMAPLAARTGQMEQLYDFDLMEGGGHVSGWLLGEAELSLTAAALQALASPEAFQARCQAGRDEPPLLFAVGDGNHSLATAKECYERQKRLTPPDQWDTLPARYALCEVVNLHDPSLDFKPIHRVVFHTDPGQLIAALIQAFPQVVRGRVPGPQEGPFHPLRYVWEGGEETLYVLHPKAQLPVGTLQGFLDEYLASHPGRIDYIHGEGVARRLAARPNHVTFLLPPMDKSSLFPTVIREGLLPRKTFSMGAAQHKRFYLEARRIR